MSKHMEKTKYKIALWCAPVIRGKKISNMIAICQEEKEVLYLILRETGLDYFLLYENEDRCIVLIFRYAWLHTHLQMKNNRIFLKSYGYQRFGFYEMLAKLKMHFEGYHTNVLGFPHELGIFLEYPIEDIKGFIQHRGKNCMIPGYWKVYQNPEYARRVFKEYDCARKEVLYGLQGGKELSELSGLPARQAGFA